jgi:trehalose 6-phosphate synthase/phosphatase
MVRYLWMKKRPNIIIVSNRLAVKVTQKGESWTLDPSTGGLKSALSGYREEQNFHWYGWPGLYVSKKYHSRVQKLLSDQEQATPIFLDRKEIDLFYNQFCNSFIWPLFHYFTTDTTFNSDAWISYQRVNEKFAEAISKKIQPGDLVWIHDFHLMLLPQLLRKKCPQAKIGFFLHIPFPSSEIYRLLPVRTELLYGLLGADLIGFHTYSYARHFRSACLHLLGYESSPEKVQTPEHDAHMGIFPVGVEVERFQTALNQNNVQIEAEYFLKKHQGKKIILGVDRLDPSKGLIQKLRGIERFLKKYPKVREEVIFIQLTVPSRIETREYQKLKRQLDEMVGRIEGDYGSPRHVPLQYLYSSIPYEKLVALYQVADVCLITPVRDGMNLVCQEYVVCQNKNHGVLVLSEFAGAAHALSGALVINPADRDQMAATLYKALFMSKKERELHHQMNYDYVVNNSSQKWGERFISALQVCEPQVAKKKISIEMKLKELKAHYKSAKKRLILLDYDGTLREYAGIPSAATPEKETLNLLKKITGDKKNHSFLVSGRDHSFLSDWFKDMPIGLSAEHGYRYRIPKEKNWKTLMKVDLSWSEIVMPILINFKDRTPGSFVEVKSCGMAWHYRLSDPEFGKWQARELLLQLEEGLSNLPVDILQGHKVIEVRAQGVNKGVFVKKLLVGYDIQPDFILCIGDDQTDEQMFQALPSEAWTCRVGKSHTSARYFISSPKQVRGLLQELLNRPQV